MKDNYVSNTEEILIANESQKNKIQFLERERVKREHFLNDLQENLHLNKATLREMNELGPNLAAIGKLTEETEALALKLRSYYDEYQNINAVLLMEKQMRLEDRLFYNERMVEFQNKIIDLRKYLHDKEDSFSSVVTRLKKYQEIAESTIDDKLANYKKEIGERHVNEFIAEIIKEKNYYQLEFEKVKKDFIVFSELKAEILEQFPGVWDIIDKYETANKFKLSHVVNDSYHSKMVEEIQEKEKKDKKSKIDPNKELIRLLKKEKLSKELHQDALHEAIEKNEELINIKQIYENSIEKLEKKCGLLHAENTIFALRLAEYDNHYCRYATHLKRYYQEGEVQGLREMTELRLKEYGVAVRKYFQSDRDLEKRFTQKLKADVQKWGQFICDSIEVKREMDKKGLITKSCSVPSLIVGFDLDEVGEEKYIIEEF